MSLRSTVWVHDRLCYSLRSCCSLRSVRGRSILSSGRIASSAMGSAGNCPRVVMHVGLGWLDLVINVSQTRSKDWIPACTAERHSHCTNMQNTLGYQSAARMGKKCSGENILGLVGSTPQKRPSHGKKVLGGIEEHLASWTKGCEGQKGSGE